MTVSLARLGASLCFVTSLALAPAVHADSDWRDDATQEEKVRNLVKVVPSTSQIMIELGERYSHLYWAANMGKWEFAAYQAEEVAALVETLRIAQPRRAKTAGEFLDRAFPEIAEAAESRDSDRFERAFAQLRQACLTCHVANDHAFITLPAIPPRSSSPVLHE